MLWVKNIPEGKKSHAQGKDKHLIQLLEGLHEVLMGQTQEAAGKSSIFLCQAIFQFCKALCDRQTCHRLLQSVFRGMLCVLLGIVVRGHMAKRLEDCSSRYPKAASILEDFSLLCSGVL